MTGDRSNGLDDHSSLYPDNNEPLDSQFYEFHCVTVAVQAEEHSREHCLPAGWWWEGGQRIGAGPKQWQEWLQRCWSSGSSFDAANDRASRHLGGSG